MPEFDFPAAIKELAEAEWECPGRSLLEIQHFLPCGICGGTGYTVPFASLRVACDSLDWSLAFHVVQHDKAEDYPCCQGRGWVPVSDVRVACWEIFENHPKIIGRMMERPDLYSEYEVKEAVIRAALAWVKEQHAQSGHVD